MTDPTLKAVEALAKVLWLAGDGETVDFQGYSVRDSETVAANLLTDPGPLLAALAEAGVLQERHQIVCSCGSIRTGVWRPHDEADVHNMTRERCYVTEWKPVSE